jgi:hypothetical protein
MKTSIVVILATSLTMPLAQADLYVELGMESGSKELVSTTSGDNLYSGGGIKLAAGVQNYINNDASIRLTLGYLGDSVTAENGSAEIDTVTFDALYLINSGPHTFGLGPTFHMNPSYHDDVAGYAAVDIEFDNAVGLMFQYGYKIVPGIEIGARVTNIEYVNNATTLDASSFGVYFSNGF